MKRLMALLLAGIMAVSMMAGCGGSGSGDSGSGQETKGEDASLSKIKIGVAVPLTGGSAELGGRVYNGAKLAVDEINEAGGVNGVQIELVSNDDKADPKEAANIANLFVSDEDMIACLAGYNSSCTLAGAPIYNDAGLVHIAVGSSSPKVSDAGDYTFRVWNSDTYRASFDLQIAIDEGYQTYGIFYQNDDFGTGALAVAQALLDENNLAHPVEEGFILGETKDFNTIITKMKEAGCDAVFAIADESELAAFATQCEAQDYHPFISATGAYNPAVPELGGEAVEGMVGDGFFDPANMPEAVQAYFDKYEEEFGIEDQDPTSPCAYIAIYMIVDALENGCTTRDEVQEYLAQLTDFETILGTLSFDENGDVQIPLVPVTIKDGEFVLFE